MTGNDIKQHGKEMAKDVFASIVGSAACVYTGQPFDTVKVRMQVHPGEFSSPVQCFYRTFVGEGLTALWRGSLPAFLGALSENAVAFAVNEELKRIFHMRGSPLPESILPFFTGGVTGFCTAFALCPADVIKCRAQLSRAVGGSDRFRDIVSSTLKSEGLAGLYTGINAQIMRDIPFYCFFFGTYHVTCQYFKKHKVPDSLTYFMAGGIAGQVGWAVSIPADVVKSIIQTSSKPTTITATIRQIIRTRGLRGFYNGIEVAIVRAFPANAALFLGYEFTRKFIS
eukprot:gene13958-29709_t